MAEIVILAGAEREILEAYIELENFQDGLGTRFSNSIDATLELIDKHPAIGSVFCGSIRRRLVKGFPHGIFYESLETRILIHAVLDLRQSPEAILRRIGHL